MLSVNHVNQTTREKISHCSWLNHFCNFNKKKYILYLDSEEYAVFFLHVITFYVFYWSVFFFLLLVISLHCYLFADCLLVFRELQWSVYIFRKYIFFSNQTKSIWLSGFILIWKPEMKLIWLFRQTNRPQSNFFQWEVNDWREGERDSEWTEY